MFQNGQTILVLKTDCYGDTAYGYLMQKKTTKQAYTGAMPAGDLFGPLPPYFHGQMPPLQVNGQSEAGIYEYTNKVIFYQEKAAAIAAAVKAAAAIRAAVPPSKTMSAMDFKAEELNGFYYTSVAFAGKKGIMYRWDDDAASADEAAKIVKRKTDRYQAEGYSILETKITHVGGKHYFFIICAKFYN